jgi:hypothetical protein
MMAKVIPFRLGAQASAGSDDQTETQPEAAGAPEPQPPGAAQLAQDIEATAQQLRLATSRLVATVPAGEQQGRLLGTYNSLLQQLQELRTRLEGATDADLLDIGRDFQGTVSAAEQYLTEAGTLIGQTGAALAPSGRAQRSWLMYLGIAAAVAVAGWGGYYFWKKSKKRGAKLGRPKKSVSADD